MIRTIACRDLIFYLTRQKELRVIRHLLTSLLRFAEFSQRHPCLVESFITTSFPRLVKELRIPFSRVEPYYLSMNRKIAMITFLRLIDGNYMLMNFVRWHKNISADSSASSISSIIWLTRMILFLDALSCVSNYWLKNNKGNYIKLYKHVKMNTTLGDY